MVEYASLNGVRAALKPFGEKGKQLYRMGFVKRRGNTKAKVAVEQFEELKS